MSFVRKTNLEDITYPPTLQNFFFKISTLFWPVASNLASFRSNPWPVSGGLTYVQSNPLSNMHVYLDLILSTTT